jgi:hypothetical protein
VNDIEQLSKPDCQLIVETACQDGKHLRFNYDNFNMISNNVPLDRAALGAGCAVLANKKYKLHKALIDLNDENLIISSLRN